MYSRSMYTPHAKEKWAVLRISYYCLSIISVPIDSIRPVALRTIGILPAALNVCIGLVVHWIYCEGFRLYDEAIPVDIVLLPTHEPSTAFLWSLSLTVALVTLGWITAALRRGQEHSRYWSSFVVWLFPIKSGFLIAVMDCVFWFCIAWHLRHISSLVSWWLMVSSVASLGKWSIISYIDFTERLETLDAVTSGRNTRLNYTQRGQFHDTHSTQRLHY